MPKKGYKPTKEHKKKQSQSATMRWSDKRKEKEFYMDVREQVEVIKYDANLTAEELQDLLNNHLRKGWQVKDILTEKCFIVFNVPKNSVITK